jgi:hypothetical protein
MFKNKILIKFKTQSQHLDNKKTAKVKFKSTFRLLKNPNYHLLTIKKNKILNLKA